MRPGRLALHSARYRVALHDRRRRRPPGVDQARSHGAARNGPQRHQTAPRWCRADRPMPEVRRHRQIRFNTHDFTFNCRKCGGRGQGSIDLQMFLDGSNLNETVEKLTGEPPPKSDGRDSGKPHHDAGAWIYYDAAGKPYLKVRRFDKPDGSKFYPQYRWEEGQWLKGKPNGPKIPYRLRELLDSDRTESVYITEG